MNQKTAPTVLFRALRCGIGHMIAKKGLFGAWLGFAALCCMAPALSAETTGTFGNFSYSDDGTSITITAYPRAAVGAVDIPSTINGEPVTSIGYHAFSGCSGLTSVTIPAGVTSIATTAFDGCSGLTSVTIPPSVASIGYAAFNGCGLLTSITIPAGVTIIENNTFSGCSGLTSVSIPSSVASIGDYAFNGCSGLTSVTISVGVISIGSNAFANCTGLTNMSIPSSVTSIGIQAFYYCTKLTSVSIPAGVISIGGSAFSNCSGLTSVTIPGSVTSFGDYAFNGCSGLTSVTISVGVISIGSNAFNGCSGLTSVTIPVGVTSIGDQAFYGCTKLTSVTIPGSVTSIGSQAFTVSGLTSLTLSAGFTGLTDGAFAGCSRLTSVTIPSSVTSIGAYAFSNCSGLTSVTIPSSVTSIGNNAFSGCSGLTSITVPVGVTSIGDNTFSGCSGLTSITIPVGVTAIGYYAFDSCSGLTSVTIPSSVTSIGSQAFYNCTKLTSVSIAAGVTSIGDSAFSGCSRLTNVTIPSSVTSIGSNTFIYCSGLTSITIPAGVTSIGNNAFYGCSGLTRATFMGNAPALGSGVFSLVASGFKVYYLNSSSGFTSPTWQGYPTQIILTQTITFGTLSAKTYGNAPFPLSATASSGLSPTFSIVSGPATISGNTVTLTGVGTVVVRAAQAGNASYAAAATVDQSFMVGQATQTITFGPLPSKTYGNAPFTLSATASSGLSPIFSIVSGPATISGNTVTLTGAGAVVVRASQAGNANYAAANSVDQSFVIKATQTITFTQPANRMYNDVPFALSATADSNLPVTFTVVSGPATLGVDGKTLTLTGTAGTVTVRASQSGNDNYIAVFADRSFTVFKPTKIQTIKFTAPTAKLMGVAPFDLVATATSGLPVTFAVVSGPATLGVNGKTLTITGAGAVVLQATQVGDTVYLPAKEVQVSFKVSQTAQKITFKPSSSSLMTASPLTLTATSSSGLPVGFAVVSGPASLGVDGKTLTFTGAGSVVVRATQSGNAVYLAAPAVQATIRVSKVAQTITFSPLPATVALNVSPLTLTATSSSGLPVTYVVTGPASLSGQTLTLTGVGTVSVSASQAGNAIFLAAKPVVKKIKVTAAVTKAKSLASKSTTALLNTLAGNYETVMVGTEASHSLGLPVGTLELNLDPSAGQYTAILTLENEADPLFITGTVEVSGTTDNPIFTGYWKDPTGTTTVQFLISGDGVVAGVSKAGQIIAETEAGVVAY